MDGMILSEQQEEELGISVIEEIAVEQARYSTCTKSLRGAVIFDPFKGIILGRGHNKVTIEEYCNPCIRESIKDNSRIELCSGMHAEQMAILDASARGGLRQGLYMLHTKIKNGEIALSSRPSCTMCSRFLYITGLNLILRQKEGFVFYRPAELNRLSFKYFLEKKQ